MIRKIIKALWILLAVVVLAIVVIFVSISKGWIGYMPPVEELENPNYKFATEIFSEDGKVLGTWSYSKENRVYTAYKDLSPNIINALIATEDVRFVEYPDWYNGNDVGRIPSGRSGAPYSAKG